MQLNRIIISNETIYIRYKCNCIGIKTIEFEKYYYGLQIVSNIYNTNDFLFYCVDCKAETNLDKSKKHTNQLRTPTIIKDYSRKCNKHDLMKEYVCLKCHIDLCLNCFKEKHKIHNYLNLKRYYDIIKTNLKNFYYLWMYWFRKTENTPHYNICYSVAHLIKIEYQTLPKIIRYKNNKMLYHVCDGFGLKDDKIVKIDNEEHIECFFEQFIFLGMGIFLQE